MANCQNNMRYGRQMNNNCRTMPSGNRNGCSNNMPSNNCAPKATPLPAPESCHRPSEPCGCHTPKQPERICQPERRCQPERTCQTPSQRGTRPCAPDRPMPRVPECQKPCMPERPMPCVPEYQRPCMPERKCCQEALEECMHTSLDNLPLAMAYVPCQKWQNLCEPCQGFQRGTIFEELIKPFCGKGGCNR